MSATATNPVCRACGSTQAAEWLNPREMMFGTRDRFAYFRCADCGCLQIAEVPANLSKYYPDNYYSYSPPPMSGDSLKMKFRRKFVCPALTRRFAGWPDATGNLLAKFFRPPTIPPWLKFLAQPVAFDGGILDVGCGAGEQLVILHGCGFTQLRGVDPFIPQSVAYPCGVRVDKCSLDAVQGRFELIMFHHVFEHVVDPLATLQQAKRLLSPDGQILIRIPLSDSVAAGRYGENWAQLDAPRHITLQTRKSMEVLARRSGLKIARVEYDSSAFQFWGSEQYAGDIPLFDARSYGQNKQAGVFSEAEIAQFSAEAERLNREAKGDQAAFVLQTLNETNAAS